MVLVGVTWLYSLKPVERSLLANCFPVTKRSSGPSSSNENHGQVCVQVCLFLCGYLCVCLCVGVFQESVPVTVCVCVCVCVLGTCVRLCVCTRVCEFVCMSMCESVFAYIVQTHKQPAWLCSGMC